VTAKLRDKYRGISFNIIITKDEREKLERMYITVYVTLYN